jgi:hypothetical protein
MIGGNTTVIQCDLIIFTVELCEIRANHSRIVWNVC